ncbi:MAG: TIGR01212 family radical SAM protein [Candidatus Rifleibacteriota bacterium]
MQSFAGKVLVKILLPVSFLEKSKYRLQKIPVNAGFSCPNRDGTLATTGCSFCANESFSPFYCSSEKTITQQLQEGISFFGRKYKCNHFLAYFQTYSGTHAPVSRLEEIYGEALKVPAIEGLVIATRPDCINSEIVDLLVKINNKSFVRLEIGVESLNDEVLAGVNRCHDSLTALTALETIKKAGLQVCVHIILGLPGESAASLKAGARKLSAIKPDLIKIHHLQIVRGSTLAESFARNPEKFKLLNPEKYISCLADYLCHLSREIKVERLINRVPEKYLVAPVWNGFTEEQLRRRLCDYMLEKRIWQGCKL